MKVSILPLMLTLALVSLAVADVTASERSDVAPTGLTGQDRVRLEKLRELAGSGAWTELAKEAGALGAHLAQNAHRDPVAYGELSTYRALAHFHLDDFADADWNWQVALNFAPEIAERTIIDFSDAAARFAQIGLPSLRGTGGLDPQLRRPEPKKMVRHNQLMRPDRAKIPWGIGVDMVIGVDGVPHSPRVMGLIEFEADRVYSSLEALRQWRFSPAVSAGTPVEFPTTLQVGITSKMKAPKGSKRF